MNTPKEVACDLGFLVPVAPRVGRTQPVASTQSGQPSPNARKKNSGKGRAKGKHTLPNSIKPAVISGAEAQQRRRDGKTNAGKGRVETWVPLQIKKRIKVTANSQGMNGEEFLAKLITEYFASK